MASSVGDSGIALGNAIGSCICNIGLIIGTVAMLTPVDVETRDFVSRSAWMVVAAVLVVLFTWDRTLSRSLAMLLLTLSFVYLAWDYVGIRRRRAQAADAAAPDTSRLPRAATMFALGAVLIVFGSRLLVDSGRDLGGGAGRALHHHRAVGGRYRHLVTRARHRRVGGAEGRPGPVAW